MRKENFLKAMTPEFLSKVTGSMCKRGTEKDLAEDSLQDAVCSMLTNKSYTKIEGESIAAAQKAILGAAYGRRKTIIRNESLHGETVLPIEDADDVFPDPADRTDFRDKVKAENECPFCHKTVARTKYKDLACPHCHTIVGRGKMYPERPSVIDSELVDMSDIDLKLDMEKAMKTLTFIERKIMEAYALKHESLDDVAIQLDMHRNTVRNIFLIAKNKMRKELAAYETV